MINDSLAKELQTTYLASRLDKDFAALHKEIQNIATSLIFLKIKGTGVYLDVREKSWDASTRFMEMYLKNPNWVCSAFAFRIDCEVKYILYNKKQRQFDSESEIPPDHILPQPTKKENIDNVIEDLMEDSVYWRNILIDCYRAKSFKAFVTKMSAYHDRAFMEEHILRLKALYKHTRRK